MAIKTGTVIARPTLSGAYTSSTYWHGVSNFLEGTGDMYTNKASATLQRFLYGFNFEEIREIASKGTVNIVGFEITTISECEKRYTSTPVGTLQINVVTNFKTSGTTLSPYTDLGDGRLTMIAAGKGSNDVYTTITKTQADMPNTLNWINANLSSFLDGITTNTFGIFVTMYYMRLQSLTITVTYEYEETPPEFTSAEMLYSGKQISQSNKVIADEGFVISVGVK